MRGLIVDLDRPVVRERERPVDRIALPTLTLGCVAFALSVWIARPATVAPVSGITGPVADATQTSSANVPRGIALRPLVLPPRIDNVDLAAMPDRLANEAAPASWRRVVTVRGVPGVASVEGPAVVAWTENGIAYAIASPTRSAEELIEIANELR